MIMQRYQFFQFISNTFFSTLQGSSKHVWLCLQSGREVVNEIVRLPIAFSGLVNVMVQALTSIPLVCQASDSSGNFYGDFILLLTRID